MPLTVQAPAGVMLAADALDPAGPVAREIARLWWLMLVLGVAVFVVFAVALAAGLLRPRGEPGGAVPEREPRAGWRLIVGAGVLMPVVVLVVIFGYTIDVMRAVPASGGSGGLVVEVTGHQWWWEFHYPDGGVTTRNELHIPVGRRVELRLTSADVVHSFWAPRLAGKLDLLPEDVNVLVIEADRPGRYHGRCAEFCGRDHAHMRFVVVADEPAAFERWVAARRGG